MPPKILAGRSPRDLLMANADIMVAVVFISVVVLIIIPIQPGMLDLLLVLNITFALTIILVTLFITGVLQLATFPSILLMATLFRLALNISSTRLILTEARAGQVIQAFGQFVVGGNYAVGFIIFVIITIVQFVVITNGAGRIAEVAARFTLDAMPGKQMSIDADFNAGLIDEDEARSRRRQVQREADFFGAMDGSSKFVRGDAIAGIVIVLINILAGFGIGIIQRGMAFEEALQTYTSLTVGDGLVAQVPALLVSTAAGMLVTRSTAESSFGEDLSRQILNFPKALMMVAAIIFLLGIVPGLPFLPFFVLALLCGIAAYVLMQEKKEEEEKKVKEEKEEAQESKKPVEEDETRALLKVEVMEIEIGYNLVSLTDTAKGGDLLERITTARRRNAAELGMIIKPIRIRDNLQLSPNDYVIKLKGNEISRGELRPGYLLALNPEGSPPEEIGGIPTKEPTFNLPAVWISPSQKDEAESMGLTVVDPSTVLITHLNETIRTHSYELLGRQEVKEMTEVVKEVKPAVVEELIPDLLSIGEVQKVLQNLLKEQLPIKDMGSILEVLADHARTTKDLDLLTEYVRQSIARTISSLYAEDNKLNVITLDPSLEKAVADSLQQTSFGTFPALKPQVAQSVMDGLAQMVEKVRQKGINPVLLASPRIRLPFRRLVERNMPDLPVLSYNEIVPQIEVEAVGVLKGNED